MTLYHAPVPMPEIVVYRELSFSVAAFNRFKHWQRYLTAKEVRHLTDGETLDRLILAIHAPHEGDRR